MLRHVVRGALVVAISLLTAEVLAGPDLGPSRFLGGPVLDTERRADFGFDSGGRLGYRFSLPGLVDIMPEVAAGYLRFGTIDQGPQSTVVNRLAMGTRLGFGQIIVPSVYAHASYNFHFFRDSTGPTATLPTGLGMDVGASLEIRAIRRVGLGGFVGFNSIWPGDRLPTTWFAAGIQGGISF